VIVMFLHLNIVNWNGDEVAQLEVIPTDTILVEMWQIEEQVGVPVHRQVLMCGEDLLESGQVWSNYGSVRDQATIQLTNVTEEVFDAASDREALMVLFERCGIPPELGDIVFLKYLSPVSFRLI
jgi:hypothetical protein